MPSSTGPNLGIAYGWNEGESGWKAEMDANLKLLDALLHLAVLDRDLAAPPGSPANGDRYIVAATATGDWVGHEDEVAVRVAGAWEFYTPAVGWRAYIEDEAKLSVWTGSAWSAGVSI